MAPSRTSHSLRPPTYAVVFFKNTLITPDPAFTLDNRSCTGIAGYPCAGANETAITGTLHENPNYDPAAFYTNDLGVVVLDQPYNPGSFGALPAADQFDSWKNSSRVTFTSVGFGSQLRLSNVGGGDILESLILNGSGFSNDGALLTAGGINVWAGPIRLDSEVMFGFPTIVPWSSKRNAPSRLLW